MNNKEAMEKVAHLVAQAKEHTGNEAVYEDAMDEQPVPTRIVCLKAEASDPRSKDATQRCVECGELVLTAPSTTELVKSGAYGELQFICISCVAQDYDVNGVAEIGGVQQALEHFKNKVRN